MPLCQCFRIATQAPGAAIGIASTPNCAVIHLERLPLGIRKARDILGKRCLRRCDYRHIANRTGIPSRSGDFRTAGSNCCHNAIFYRYDRLVGRIPLQYGIAGNRCLQLRGLTDVQSDLILVQCHLIGLFLCFLRKGDLAQPQGRVRSVISVLFQQDGHGLIQISGEVVFDLGSVDPLALMNGAPAVVSEDVFPFYVGLRFYYLNGAILQNHAQPDVDVVIVRITARVQQEARHAYHDLIRKDRFRDTVGGCFLRNGPSDKLGIVCQRSNTGGRIPAPLRQCFRIAT